MRFRNHQEESAPELELMEEEGEEERIRRWQSGRLAQLGYEPDVAAAIVLNAWMEGDHNDLAHRIEELIGRGATLDQAARIVVPAPAGTRRIPAPV